MEGQGQARDKTNVKGRNRERIAEDKKGGDSGDVRKLQYFKVVVQGESG